MGMGEGTGWKCGIRYWTAPLAPGRGAGDAIPSTSRMRAYAYQKHAQKEEPFEEDVPADSVNGYNARPFRRIPGDSPNNYPSSYGALCFGTGLRCAYPSSLLPTLSSFFPNRVAFRLLQRTSNHLRVFVV